MTNKTNLAFLNAYIELESVCSQKLDVARGGVTEYINRLMTAKSIPGRNELLPSLVRYRNLRNRMAHEKDALSHIKAVGQSDVRWIKSFTKEVSRGKDPLSVYYRKLGYSEKWRKIRAVLIPSLIGVGVVAVAVLLIVLEII